MSRGEPNNYLIDLGLNEWRFQESTLMQIVTQRFDQIRESASSDGTYASQLKRLIKGHSDHIDALHHYGLLQTAKGKHVEAFTFAHAAVAVGKSCFTDEFIEKKGRLPGGFVPNRPFLRAMHGLMCAQAKLGDYRASIKTGKELMTFDRDDRMGARLELPLHYIILGDYSSALEIFEMKGFADSFGAVVYLKALALQRLNRLEECKAVLEQAINGYPHVARYILNDEEPPPSNDSMIGGIIWGSPYEGWYYAMQFGKYWRFYDGALEFLKIQAANLLGGKWVKYTPRMSSQ